MAVSSQKTPGQGKRVHPSARPGEPRAARAALGARRKSLRVRGRIGSHLPRADVRRARTARRVSRYVQPGHGRSAHHVDHRRGVLFVFVLDGQLQRHHRPPEPPRHHDGRRLPGALRDVGGLQAAHGLVVPVVLLGRQRLQLRLSRVVYPGRTREWQAGLQLRAARVWNVRGAGYQRFCPGRRRHLPHVLRLRSRPGHAECRLPLHGPGAEGSRRGPEHPGRLAATSRRVRRLMSHAQMLASVGLIRPTRRRGFCPACRLFQADDGPREISAPAVIALVWLIVALGAWAVVIARMSSMDDMSMGLGSIDAFAAGWTLMMAAMMLPSATPLVFEFARQTERRRGWRAATAVLAATYVGVWLAFGLVCYGLYTALGMPWPRQSLVGGVALVCAGLYALTPLKRASEARCRELCALHGPLPFNLTRSAVVAGGRYALSCLGCTAGLMLAMLLIGTSSLAWMIAVTVVILIYKLAPAATVRWSWVLAAAVIALGVFYAVTA